MPTPPPPFRFDVAFSFAGPHRDKVRAVAELVATRLGKPQVFFDEWYEYEVLGDDMDVLLQRFYHEQSLLVVADVSEDSASRPWCQAEARAIRALRFEIDPARDETQRLRLLNTRFGPGDAPGVFKTGGYLDGVNKTAEQCADLILNRLALLRERLSMSQPADPGTQLGSLVTQPATSVASQQSAAPTKWPAQPTAFKHGLADRAVNEWPAVQRLLTVGAPKRILMFKGPSGFSKSALLDAAARYAKKLLQVPVVYVDFKVSKLLIEANALRELQFGLASVLPGFATAKEPDRWVLRRALRELKQPALIVLDTYERVTETKDLVEWLETQLLAEADECDQLRFLIGGQKVPDVANARWREQAEQVELDRIHDQTMWRDWIHELNPNVDDKHVEGIVLGLEGIAGNISTVLRTCAQNLSRLA
jgi:hypothetical protein